MAEGEGGSLRRRNSVLQALEAFDQSRAPRPFHAIVLFLYVCENEGLSVTELAYVSGSSVATTARTVRVLAGIDSPRPGGGGPPLFELETSTADRRLKFIRLSPAGRAVRDRIDRAIAAAVPISAPIPRLRLQIGDQAPFG
jgi:hypothetical protein